MTNSNIKRSNSRKPAKLLVYKPYLKGLPVSALAARRGLRPFSYLLISAVLYFFLGQLLSVEYAWFRLIINLVVIFAFAFLMYSDGVGAGEGDVAFAEIALSRPKEGKAILKADLARCYHPSKGFFTVIIGSLPIILLCLVYAFMAKEDTYTLGVLPSWVSSFENKPDVGPALAYYHDRAGFQLADLLRLLTRLMIFPYINLIGADNSAAVVWIERLSPILVYLIPMAYGVGYLQGPRYRARIHGGIKSNQQRAQRKQKHRKEAARQKPKQLV